MVTTRYTVRKYPGYAVGAHGVFGAHGVWCARRTLPLPGAPTASGNVFNVGRIADPQPPRPKLPRANNPGKGGEGRHKPDIAAVDLAMP